jgi:hypothetical protein
VLKPKQKNLSQNILSGCYQDEDEVFERDPVIVIGRVGDEQQRGEGKKEKGAGANKDQRQMSEHPFPVKPDRFQTLTATSAEYC